MNTKILTTAAFAAFAAASAFAETYEITQWGETISPESSVANPFYDCSSSQNLNGNTYVIKIAGGTAESPLKLLDSNGTTYSQLIAGKGGYLEIDGHYIASRLGTAVNLLIRDGSSLTITGSSGSGVNFWGGSVSTVTIGESANSSAKLISVNSTMMFKNDVILNGELSSTNKSYKSNKFTYMFNNATFNAGSKINSASGAGFTTFGPADSVVSNTITINSGVAKSALSVAGVVNFADKTTVNFNATDAFSTDSNTQAKSTFSLISYKHSNGTIVEASQSAADVVFNSTANNSFGQIQFWETSTLTLNLDTKSFMAFGEFTMHSDAAGSCTIFVNNLSESSKTFFISDKIYEAIAASEVVLLDSDGNTLSYIATRASDADFALTGLDSELGGGYWLATSTVVPEPATYAAIFGLFALGFIAYRKRR